VRIMALIEVRRLVCPGCGSLQVTAHLVYFTYTIEFSAELFAKRNCTRCVVRISNICNVRIALGSLNSIVLEHLVEIMLILNLNFGTP